MILPLGTCRSSCYSLVHFYSEVTKNFRNLQKKMKRFLRGSSSRSLKDKQSEEDKRPKYNLPRTVEVRPCEWPCDNFLRAAGIYDDFYDWLRMQASPPSSTTNANSISYSPISLCKTFISMLGAHHLRWNFIYMMSIRRCHFMIFVGFV